MARPDLQCFRKKALKRPDVAEEYERLSPAYELRRQLVALRQKAGLTQEDVARRLNSAKSNISRLESVNSSISPKLLTIVDYAEVIGYDIRIEFVPRQRGKPEVPWSYAEVPIVSSLPASPKSCMR